MTPIEHQIKAIKQATGECMQTATAQMLSFFDASIDVDQVLAEVPVAVNGEGEKLGTSPGHIAAYCVRMGFKTTAYIFDTELFDRTWQGLSANDVVDELQLRQKYIPSHSWLAQYHQILVDGWQQFQQAGGDIALPFLESSLLRRLLDNGPFLVMVNATYLNGGSKRIYHKATDSFSDDPLRGVSMVHAVTCAGYSDGEFLIIDPEPPEDVGHERRIGRDHLLASIMSAQTESANLLIAVTG